MCATKLFTMRTPTEEQFHKISEAVSSTGESSTDPRSYHPYHPEHQLLSRQTRTYVRNPSVPALLNTDSQPDTTTREQVDVSPHRSSLSRNREPGLTLAVQTSPLTHEPVSDLSGQFITPPSSSTRVHFKTPVWKRSSEHNEFIPAAGLTTSGMTPTRHRQGSMESLMRAAATVEGDIDLNKTYQDKVATIIELKNQVSNAIRNWPIAKETSIQEAYSAGHAPDKNISEVSGKILLNEVSCENLTSLEETTQSLGNTVRELVDLKKHIRFLMESDAALSHAKAQPESERRVTLPPIERLTMNLPKTPSKSFQYLENESAIPAVGPPTLEHQSRSGSLQESHDQPTLPGAVSSSSWPAKFTARGHRPTLSDPLVYRSVSNLDVSLQKAHYSKPVAVPVPTGARHIIVCAQGNLSSPVKLKNNTVKKRKKFLSDRPSQDYRRSLTHGLLLSEPSRRDEQLTTSCVHCGENSTPEWRRGPYGNRTLCNACGLFYRKLIKKFGIKDANMLMRFRKQINPDDRRVPTILNVPAAFTSSLDHDNTLDAEYNTIGGSNNPNQPGL